MKFGTINVTLAIVLCMGCSSSNISSSELANSNLGEHKYNVSVTADGKEVTDFNKKLVHDVAVSSDQLGKLGRRQNSMDMLFVSEPEVDLRGSVVGVRVLGSRSGMDPLGAFGWIRNDVITAVGLKQVRSVQDIGLLVSQLQQKGSATVTIIREGEPHKMLYTVRRNS